MCSRVPPPLTARAPARHSARRASGEQSIEASLTINLGQRAHQSAPHQGNRFSKCPEPSRHCHPGAIRKSERERTLAGQASPHHHLFSCYTTHSSNGSARTLSSRARTSSASKPLDRHQETALTADLDSFKERANQRSSDAPPASFTCKWAIWSGA